MKSILSTQEHRYRSVKYKINRDISLSINEPNRDTKIMLPSTAKYTANSTRRNGNKFSVTYLTNYKSKSFVNSEGLQQQKAKKTTYMDTFNFMLNMERNKYNFKQKELQEEEQEKQRQKYIQNPEVVASRNSRVQLPVLNQLDSYFTVLDNIHLPINYISDQIPKIAKQIAVQQQNIKKIAHQIKQLQKKALRQIAELQDMGTKGFQKLRNMLKANRVTHQQQNLKLKNALEKCRDYLPQYYNTFDVNKDRLKSLQKTIFKDTPFELEQQKQFQLISTKYF